MTVTNRAENSLEIVKLDFYTRTPLSGATFKIEHADGKDIGTYNTDSAGKILIGNLKEGAYVVSEIKSPDGYQLDSEPQTIVIEGGKLQSVEFLDKPLSGIQIIKTDAYSHVPLPGATFIVERDNGERIGSYKTDAAGKIVVSGLDSGTYIVSETIAPEGYQLDAPPQTVVVKNSGLTVAEFADKPLSGIEIVKTGENGQTPLIGAVFSIEKVNGERIGKYTTDVAGKILIHDLAEGVYIVAEVQAPVGYLLGSTPQTVEVKSGKLTIVEFTNKELPSLYIRKVDRETGELVAGAEFLIEKDGVFIATVVSGANMAVVVPHVQPGFYRITETKAPAGYELNSPVQTVEVRATGDAYYNDNALPGNMVTFGNEPLNSLEIVKLDSVTHNPLPGALFEVTKATGEHIGSYRTDASGKILIPEIEEGTYVVAETAAPQGYILSEASKSVNVSGGRLVSVQFLNKPLSGIEIVKMDSVTRQPLANAEFSVSKSDGERIGTFRTGADGKALVSDLTEGEYVVGEISAPGGYQLDETPKIVTVKSGKLASAEFVNKPISGIEIVKMDSVTRQPLADAEFSVTKADGERIGAFRTESDGKVLVSGLDEGVYIVGEISAPSGYQLDETPKNVTVTSGKLAAVEFTNKPLSGIEIVKLDSVTRQPLAGAEFSVTKADGARVGTFKTESDGKVLVSDLDEGVYIVGEISAPDGYQLDESPKNITVKSGKLATAEFTNKPYSGIQILKTDSVTHKPLSGATFEVKHANGETVGTYKTDVSGKALINGLAEGSYIVSETIAPDNYILDNTPQTVTAKTGRLTAVEFVNKPFSGIEIRKADAVNGNALAGAVFEIRTQSGEYVAEVSTDSGGKASVANVEPGWFVIAETKAPAGYVIDGAAKTVEVKSGAPTVVTFTNKPLSGIEILKLDAVTKAPLMGASFTLEKDDGEKIGTYKTDSAGKIIISGLTEGTYIVSETAPPDGYILDAQPQTVIVKSGKLTAVEFTNKPLSGIEILKLDTVTKAPLMGAEFVLEKDNGEKIGTYKTDSAGKIIISGLAEGTYIVSETAAPDGYILDAQPQTIIVKSGKLMAVEFTNKPLSGIEILKLDAETKAPLMGAEFVLEKDSGEKIGTYKTDSAGKIIVSGLTEGTYIVSETNAPDGYILDAQPQTVIVKSGKLTAVEFINKPLAGLKIIKLDSETRRPIEGVEFAVSKMDGERIENDFRATTFKTDRTGQILIPQLENGYYTVTETRAADGYLLDGEPKTVLIESGKTTLLEVFNSPMSGLLIVKTDEATSRPLEGVVFDVRRADGQFVTGYISDGNQPNTEANSSNKTTTENGDISGSYTTDTQGRIRINTLPAGEYHVIERKALDGYELDENVHAVTVTPGKLATLQITNKAKAGFRLLKIDSVTKQPIFGVEFMVFDANNKQVGTYVTDNNGVIDFDGILTEGRYTLRETHPADGYYRDDMPRTVEFKSGKTTEVVWENTPEMGQIQITKLAGDDNEANGLEKGSPLAGATFEVYHYKSGNLLDRFVSGTDGRAVSKPLPTGRYLVKEVQAPQYYRVSDEVMDIEIEFATQIIKREFLNYSANTGVKIRKAGAYEAMPGDTIRYDIKEAANTSSVQLTDFFWRDVIPTDAVRLNKIVTGTYSQSLKYKILVTTNKGDQRVIADNLSTTENHTIDCRNAALGLANDEYVTSFTLVFGTVKSGFTLVQEAQVYTTVNKNIPNGYEFGNKADIGGKYNGEFVVGGSTWVTKTYAQPTKLPRTGY